MNINLDRTLENSESIGGGYVSNLSMHFSSLDDLKDEILNLLNLDCQRLAQITVTFDDKCQIDYDATDSYLHVYAFLDDVTLQLYKGCCDIYDLLHSFAEYMPNVQF